MGDGVRGPVCCKEEGIDGCDESIALGRDPELEKVKNGKTECEKGCAPEWVVTWDDEEDGESGE